MRAPFLRQPAYVALVVALIVQYYLIWPYMTSTAQDFDAVNLYLPLAHGLSEHGWRFFLDEESIRAPAFSYVYPLIFGQSLPALKLANALLSGFTLVLVFRCASLLHSTLAGAIAAALFALSPLMRPYLAAPITEGPVIFLGALWLWGVSECLIDNRTWAGWVAGLALGLAALTRATMFYWIPLTVFAFGWQSVKHGQPAWRRLLGAHLLALALPAAFIVKNWLVFHFAFFTTGGGNAVYLGNNPVTGGYDPNYLGLYFDVGSIARDIHHLSLRAERLLSGVAWIAISQQSLPSLLALHARKLTAFLFVTSAEPEAALFRSWRLGLAVFAVLGMWYAPRPALRWLVGGMLAFQIAIYMPVLYTHRYSVGAIDLWLLVLAGSGLASILTMRRPARALTVALVAVSSCITLGYLALTFGARPQPNVFAAPRQHISDAPPFQARLSGPQDRVEISVGDKAKMIPWANYIVVLDAQISTQGHSRCSRLLVSYKPNGDADFHGSGWQRLRSDGKRHLLQFGGAPLRLNSPGTLRLATDCDGPALLQMQRAAVYMPLGSIVWREQLLGEPHMFTFEQ